MSKISIIIGREFKERVYKKSFIIATVLTPLLMIALMTLPALIMKYSSGDEKRISVVDRSGLIAPHLEDNEELKFVCEELPEEEFTQISDQRFGVLCIGENIVAQPSDVKLYVNSSLSVIAEESLRDQIAHIIRDIKLRSYNIENLDQILKNTETEVNIQTIRNDKGEEDNSSSMVATAISYILGFILYMFLLIYGSIVMQSVIEEKNSRVLDVMITSVKPFELMMGKILGVACVAVVQILIWSALLMGMSAFVLPHLLPADLLSQSQALQQGMVVSSPMEFDPDLTGAVAALTDFGYMAEILGFALLFLVGGYLLYSALFAAIGSAVDSVQDASQLQTPVTLPIILSLFVMIVVIRDPNSQIAFWFSMIPFTSPMVMMARIPFGIPMWEIGLSLTVLYASFVAIVWMAGKIYRVGIMMHGSKPSFKEIFRWIRHQ